MIFPQTDLNAHLVRRYKPIAGPYRQNEEGIFEAALAALKSCNARVLTVIETRGDVHRGVSIYRLRSEWETPAETRMKQKLARC